MKKYLVATALSLTIFSSCTEEKTLTVAEVEAVITRFDEAWKNKNAAVVDSVLSPQYIYFTQSGHIFNRAELVLTAGSSVYQLQTMERQQYSIQLEGNTAVVNTVWKGKGSYHGENFDDRQRCSITIVKHKNQIKILSEHCTPVR